MNQLITATICWMLYIVGSIAVIAGLMAVIFVPHNWLSWAIFIGGIISVVMGFKLLKRFFVI